MKPLKQTLTQIWNNKSQIAEGIKNTLLKDEYVEQVAFERMVVCEGCDKLDLTGEGCLVPGTHPCCNINKGGCGCSLQFKVRSLSSNCPQEKWLAVMSQEEEDKLI